MLLWNGKHAYLKVRPTDFTMGPSYESGLALYKLPHVDHFCLIASDDYLCYTTGAGIFSRQGLLCL